MRLQSRDSTLLPIVAAVIGRAGLMLVLALAPIQAHAEVHFGSSVYVGGHAFSHRTYRSFHLRVVPRLPGPPGCRIIPHGSYQRGDGTIVRGRIERCNLIAIPHRR